ncbi:MAG: hypothetical protein HYU70_00575 [Bacteroidetes bacterium]|nr:hypothetical protein [Bacteroidota bacterium]
MLSRQTLSELAAIIERLPKSDLNRLFQICGLGHLVSGVFNERMTNAEKAKQFLSELMYPSKQGPYSGDLHLDTIQYLVDRFYRYEDDPYTVKPSRYPPVHYNQRFAADYKALCHYLKIDGYVVDGRTIRQLLVSEFQEAATETELTRLLDHFGFDIAKGHLTRGRNCLTTENWSGANGEFRKFVEQLMVDLANKLLPGRDCQGVAQAIQLLSQSITPPFLSAELNEVEHDDFKHPFIITLWKRLHPEGGHRGLSSEDEGIFRLHLVVAFGYHLLKRLNKRLEK